MPEYKVLSPLLHDNTEYKPEDTVEMEITKASILCDLQILEIKQVREKLYKNMNVAEQTVVINEFETIEALEALRADTKATALPVLEEKIKSLQQPEEGQA